MSHFYMMSFDPVCDIYFSRPSKSRFILLQYFEENAFPTELVLIIILLNDKIKSEYFIQYSRLTLLKS